MINVDNWEAGPASYNTSRDLALNSRIYPNPPRPIISKGKKNPSMYISNAQSREWLCSCTPGANKYSPNATLLFKSSSVPKFGNEKRKDHFSTGRDRSPGSIYNLPEFSVRAPLFGKGAKSSPKPNEFPSPNAYNPAHVQTKLPIKIKGYISEKIYSKNYERYYKGDLGPGPAGYIINSGLTQKNS